MIPGMVAEIPPSTAVEPRLAEQKRAVLDQLRAAGTAHRHTQHDKG
jgi:hypothetical protein